MKILVTGSTGMVGSGFIRNLENDKTNQIVAPKRAELDLRSKSSVFSYFESVKPNIVYLIAAKVGGIQANIDSPGEFIYDNLMIQSNLIEASRVYESDKVIFLGSSCIYPRNCRQPMREQDLLTGDLEPTNEAYAIAKICGIKMLKYYEIQYGLKSFCGIPCNLYGTNDHFDPRNSHVLSSLVKRFVDAKNANAPSVEIWGSGIARREFMHVDDLVAAVMYLQDLQETSDPINIGTGTDVSIQDLAEMIKYESGYSGDLVWDISKPDGMLRKCMDITKSAELGFRPKIDLETGIRRTIAEYRATI
jgi:GDP-L-fucose synthase